MLLLGLTHCSHSITLTLTQSRYLHHKNSTFFQLHRVPSTVTKYQPQQNATAARAAVSKGENPSIRLSHPNQRLLLKGLDPPLLWACHPLHHSSCWADPTRALNYSLLFFPSWILPKETTRGSDERSHQSPRRDGSTWLGQRTELCFPGVAQAWIGSGAPSKYDSKVIIYLKFPAEQKGFCM